MQYWLGVVSENHVKKGMAEGFAQVCHGKRAPLARIKKGDWLVYYSPTLVMGGKEPCQNFTALGQAVDDELFSVKMAENFTPFRRKIAYLPCQPIPIQQLKDQLVFTQEKNWGYQLKFGLIPLCFEDFEKIKNAMQGFKHAHPRGVEPLAF